MVLEEGWTAVDVDSKEQGMSVQGPLGKMKDAPCSVEHGAVAS